MISRLPFGWSQKKGSSVPGDGAGGLGLGGLDERRERPGRRDGEMVRRARGKGPGRSTRGRSLGVRKASLDRAQDHAPMPRPPKAVHGNRGRGESSDERRTHPHPRRRRPPDKPVPPKSTAKCRSEPFRNVDSWRWKRPMAPAHRRQTGSLGPGCD